MSDKYEYNRKRRQKLYDYRKKGCYFVTLITKERIPYFGRIKNGKMILNKAGLMARKYWQEIPEHYPHAKLDSFVIMPEHIHGIIIINECVHSKISSRDQWQAFWARSLSSIIRGYKTAVTKHYRYKDDYEFGWQKSYHDRILRDENMLALARKYIAENPKHADDT